MCLCRCEACVLPFFPNVSTDSFVGEEPRSSSSVVARRLLEHFLANGRGSRGCWGMDVQQRFRLMQRSKQIICGLLQDRGSEAARSCAAHGHVHTRWADALLFPRMHF